MQTDILYLNGSSYENGKNSGEYFKQNMVIDLNHINELLKDNHIKDL